MRGLQSDRHVRSGAAERGRLLARLPVTERRVQLAGVSTSVLEGGEGPPVVLLHGPGGNATHFSRVVPDLVSTCRVVVPDLPGHGASGTGALDPAAVLAWLGELVERLCPTPPVLVGHALGGALAARFAVEHGDRLAALVLVDALGLAPFAPQPEFAQALTELFAQPGRDSHERMWRQCAHDLDRVREDLGDTWEALAGYDVDRVSDAGVRSAVQALVGAFAAEPVPARDLARVRVATRLVWGRADRATPLSVAQQVSAQHGWPLQVVEECGDDPAVEQPRALVDAVRAVLPRPADDGRGVVLAGLDGARVVLPAARLAALRQRLQGRVLRPGDEGWEQAVQVWNGMVARRPALVVQPASAQDVAATVALARELRLLLSVKSGGHNIAGTALADGALTLDTSLLREVAVDPVARLARVGAGCRLRDVDRATQQHGLATVLGFVSEVGVAGLTLGGGLGYLTRRFGWTVDNLEAVEVVTADGQVRTASRAEHPDLFWAVRGAGANVGVVTSLTLRLHPVGPTVVGGLVAWPFERAEEVLRTYRALTADAPRELAVWLALLRAPAAPFVPEQWHGQRLAAMTVCWTGDPAQADRALAPVRALGDPVVDLVGELPYAQLQSLLDATEPAGAHYYWKTEFMAALPDGLLADLRELFAECPVPGAQLGVLHLAGALNERADDDGAVGNRDARYALGVNGMWEPGEPEADRFQQWVRSAWQRLRPYGTGGNYVNFQGPDEGEDRLRASYGANLARLTEVKQQYDPENLFRVNRNVPRAAGTAPSGRPEPGAARAAVRTTG